MTILQIHPKGKNLEEALEHCAPCTNAIWKAHTANKLDVASKIQTLMDSYFLMSSPTGICASSAIVANLGKPDFKMKNTEHNPGAWFFKHEPSQIHFVVWSDGYKAKPMYGTSLEYYACSKLDQLPDALENILKHLIALHPNALQEHQEKLEAWRMQR